MAAQLWCEFDIIEEYLTDDDYVRGVAIRGLKTVAARGGVRFVALERIIRQPAKDSHELAFRHFVAIGIGSFA